MMNYKIVEEQSRYKLINSVETAIRDGWKPQGGVSFQHHGGYKETWAQAMIKD